MAEPNFKLSLSDYKSCSPIIIPASWTQSNSNNSNVIAAMGSIVSPKS
jgi:hypothetical protein